MTPNLVLVHGGGFDARCWDRLVPHLHHDALAVDLPGRGASPADLRVVRVADFVAAVADELIERDLRDVVLVGHSLAGITLPGVTAAVPARLRRLVFVSCTVPCDGQSIVDTLDPGVREMAEAAAREADPEAERLPLDAAVAEVLFGNDMDDEQKAWMCARLVPEANQVVFEPTGLDGLDQRVPRTWIRLLRDAVVAPAKQDQFIETVGRCEVVDLDAGHMAMVTRPAELAAILDRIAEVG